MRIAGCNPERDGGLRGSAVPRSPTPGCHSECLVRSKLSATTNGTRHPLICAEFNERASGRKFLDDGLCFTHAVRHVLRSHSHRQPRSSVNKCPAPTRCETCAPYAQQRDPRNSHLLRPHPPQATVNPPQAGAYRRHGDNQRAIPSPRCQSPCRTVAAVRVAASASTRTACQSG